MEYIFIWPLFAIVGAMIGSGKDNAGTGFALGLLLGPLGLIIIALMKGYRVKCPQCDSMISPKANICPQCGTSVRYEVDDNLDEDNDGVTLPYKQWEIQWKKENPDMKTATPGYFLGRYEQYERDQKKIREKIRLAPPKAKPAESKSPIIEPPESKSPIIEPPESTSIEERLRTVAGLHEKGLLDEEEFKNKKAEIIKEI